MMTSTRSSSLKEQLTIIEVGKKKFSLATLKAMLPDVETALFFSKALKLGPQDVSTLVHQLFQSTLTDALTQGSHSLTLQDYVVDLAHTAHIETGEITFDATLPSGEILPEVWAHLEVEVAESIQAVVDKLDAVLDKLPGKEGSMLFKTLAKMNMKRPTIGQYQAVIHHAPVADNLVILDVSGSMSESTVRAIIDDVVALSYKANAHLAIVSNSATHWEPGTYNTDVVLRAAEYSGTHYEELAPLFNQNWGTVVTIADYDSSASARDFIKSNATGSVGQVLDISLVNTPTFLAECVGQLAQEVKPLLLGNSYYVLN